MTFIASVIARKGVAVVADSLATFSEKVVTYERFMNYLENRDGYVRSGGISINRNEMTRLFKKKPSYTTDYAEKLFQFDKFTAITLAGASQIGGKTIEKLIQELAAFNKDDGNYHNKTVTERVSDFCEFMDCKVRACIAAKGRIGRSILLFTHYDTATEKTIIYRIVIHNPVRMGTENNEWKYVSYEKISETRYVVSEGQDLMCNRILGKESNSSYEMIPYIVKKIVQDFNLPVESLPPTYVQQLVDKIYLMEEENDSVMQAFLSKLSLQQAVDMAYLFLKIEITFQTYTNTLPTVGGRIKIAVIDEQGFRYITGHNILKPY